ncbi:hypothetical protein PENSPDRAFT_379574 [Peniophora sp. CONT]|nr:hypothetical protein PENSPDRAFT_379574 [Peniophora sp. CONT]
MRRSAYDQVTAEWRCMHCWHNSLNQAWQSCNRKHVVHRIYVEMNWVRRLWKARSSVVVVKGKDSALMSNPESVLSLLPPSSRCVEYCRTTRTAVGYSSRTRRLRTGAREQDHRSTLALDLVLAHNSDAELVIALWHKWLTFSAAAVRAGYPAPILASSFRRTT